MMHVGLNAESRQHIAIQKPDHHGWKGMLRRVFQTSHVLAANGLRSTNEGKLDFGAGSRGSFHRPSFHQSQGITNQPLELGSRGGIQLLQGLINFQCQCAHAPIVMHSVVLCIHKFDAPVFAELLFGEKPNRRDAGTLARTCTPTSNFVFSAHEHRPRD